MKSPRAITRILLVFTVLAAGFLDYWSYSAQLYKDPGTYASVLQGTAAAPEQYRIGVIRTAYFLAQHAHMQPRHAFALLDVIAGLVAGFVLLGLLERSAAYRASTNMLRWLASAAFLFLVAYYLAWLTWYQRPETLTNTMLIALTLLLLTKRTSNSAQYALIVIGMLALTAAQSLVRADVGFCLHAGIFLFCFFPAARGLSLPRGMQAALSGVCVLLAGGVQFVLMHKIYPHASYGATPVVQLKLNMLQPLRIFPFVVFIAPWAYTFYETIRRKYTADAASVGLLVGSVVFLSLWSVLGKIDEVRIFLPFAFALIPFSVQIAMLDVQETAS